MAKERRSHQLVVRSLGDERVSGRAMALKGQRSAHRGTQRLLTFECRPHKVTISAGHRFCSAKRPTKILGTASERAPPRWGFDRVSGAVRAILSAAPQMFGPWA